MTAVRIVAFGTYDVSTHPRVGALIEGLREHGHDVTEINKPLGIDTDARVAMLRQPWRVPLLAIRLLTCWSALTIAALRTRGAVDAVLVGYLGHFDVLLARHLFRRSPILLDHLVSAAGTAADRSLADGGGLKARLMQGIDRRALAAADIVIVDTIQQLDALPAAIREHGVVCPVGATSDWFGNARVDRPRLPGPLRVIFVGVFTPLHGAQTIARAIALLADDARIEFTMVGTGQDQAEARTIAKPNPRVTWIDWINSTDLPMAVAAHDVSLGIFGTTAKALNVVPTKAYQGAAVGCCVLTSDTPPQRDALNGCAALIAPGDPHALAARLSYLAADPAEVERLRLAAHERALSRFTASAIVIPLLHRLAQDGRGHHDRRIL